MFKFILLPQIATLQGYQVFDRLYRIFCRRLYFVKHKEYVHRVHLIYILFLYVGEEDIELWPHLVFSLA